MPGWPGTVQQVVHKPSLPSIQINSPSNRDLALNLLLKLVGVEYSRLLKDATMYLLLIILLLLLIGALPVYPYSRSWGAYPSGGLGLVLVIILILFLMGRI
jgi:Protein of unknown function (DUF3309)